MLPKQTEYIAGIYLRLSKDDERNGESLSIENQRRILTDYVKEQGWTLYDEYVDDGISGVSFDRPGVQRMLDDAKNGKINLIICKDMSRFGRNYIQVGQYVDYIFPSYNIRFIALNDNIDTANAESASMDMLPIMNIFNEWHAANTSKKLKAVIASGAKAGKYKTPNPSYGYLKGDDEFCTPVVDPYAADVVRRIFEMRAKGMSLLQICGVLNEEKILLPSDYRCQRTGQVNKTTNDHLWGIGNVKCILNNEMYLGHLCQLKTTTVSYKNHKVIRKGKEDWVIIENNHEPIISQELWDKVREYEKSVSRGKMTKSRVTVPLSGMMYCQDCGNKMRVHSGAGGNKMLTGYTCGLHSRCGKGCCSSHYIREYIMEEIVLNDIKAMIDLTIDEDAAKQIFLAKRSGMHDTQSAKDSKRIAYVKDRLTELDRMIVKVYEDNVNGKVPDEVCKTLLEKYQAEKTSLQAEQAELEKRMETAMQDEQDVEEFIRRLKKYAGAEALTREMCLDLIEYVTVDEYVKDRIIDVGNDKRWKNTLVNKFGADKSKLKSKPKNWYWGYSSVYDWDPEYDFDRYKLWAFLCAYYTEFDADDNFKITQWEYDSDTEALIKDLFNAEYTFVYTYSSLVCMCRIRCLHGSEC